MQDDGIHDTLETYNRNVYNFNEGFDKTILKPTAKVYKSIIPWPLRLGVQNFFSNISEIPTVINDVLQLNFRQAASDTWRFTINTTVGIGGTFDVAKKIGLPHHRQDFGLTLAKWGWKDSSYFVIPFLGPSTIRDTVAFPVNYFFFTPWPHVKPDSTRDALLATDIVSIRARYLDFENARERAAFDPYVFQRDAYLQRRNFLIKENHLEDESTDFSDNPDASTQATEEAGKDPFLEAFPDGNPS